MDQTELSKISIFFHDLGVGGAERVMLQIAHGLVQKGYSVDLVLAKAEGPLDIEVPHGVQVIDFNTRSPAIMFWKLVKYLRRVHPEALLSPFEVTSVVAIVAKKITGVTTRIIVRVSVQLSKNQRTSYWKKRLEQFVISRLYPLADEVVAVSHGVARDLAAYTGLPLERIEVIYNPSITEQMLQASREPVSHPFFDTDQIPVILAVGRYTFQKDFPTLIRAFAELQKSLDARLVIIGDGEDRNALEQLVQEYELQDKVDLHGFELNPYAFMKRSNVFVLSSKWEGLPSVLIQALACGCPVVSTNCPSGPSEILADGVYGELIPVGDPKSMMVAIQNILAGKRYAPAVDWIEQFTLSSILPKYQRVLGGTTNNITDGAFPSHHG